MKAGFMPDAWFDKNTKISRFSGQVFTETKPKGEIMEKKLDGSNC
jgi:AMMECR1 domain-containing protein